MAKEFLSQKGYKFIDFDVTKDRAALDEMVKISGARSVPVIAACNEVMVGFDRNRLGEILAINSKAAGGTGALPGIGKKEEWDVRLFHYHATPEDDEKVGYSRCRSCGKLIVIGTECLDCMKSHPVTSAFNFIKWVKKTLGI